MTFIEIHMGTTSPVKSSHEGKAAVVLFIALHMEATCNLISQKGL